MWEPHLPCGVAILLNSGHSAYSFLSHVCFLSVQAMGAALQTQRHHSQSILGVCSSEPILLAGSSRIQLVRNGVILNTHNQPLHLNRTSAGITRSEKHQLMPMACRYLSLVTWKVMSWLCFLIDLKEETWTCGSSVESDAVNDACGHWHYLVALSESVKVWGSHSAPHQELKGPEETLLDIYS